MRSKVQAERQPSESSVGLCSARASGRYRPGGPAGVVHVDVLRLLVSNTATGGNAMNRDDLMRRIHGTDIYVGYLPTLAEDLQGWNSAHPAFDDIIAETRPLIVIDVGVWKGGSTLYLADRLRQHDIAGTVIAVDTFLGSLEHSDAASDLFRLAPPAGMACHSCMSSS
jgi:hypothetical protein